MTILGKFTFTTGAQNPSFSAYLADDNTVNDYYSFDYTSFEQSLLQGVCYGSFFLKDAPSQDTSTKIILSFIGGGNTLEIRENRAGGGTYVLEFDLNGSTFITPNLPPSSDWRWFYFYCDYEYEMGFIELNGVNIGFDTIPAGIEIIPASIDTVHFLSNSTYDAGQRFGRLYVDFDQTVTSTEFLNSSPRFARNDGTLIVSKDLGEFGQIGTGNIPCLYMKLKSSVHLDSRGEEFTAIGAPTLDFNNAAPIIIVI